MSRSDENFLTRWSRRKQRVEAAEEPRRAVPPPSPATGEGDYAKHGGGGECGAPVIDDRPPPPPSAVTLPRCTGEESDAPAAETQEPLPRVEDLTSASDLSAFLRGNVPEALKRAALRRMWSLDPAIRDFVGLSENAWDFNDPASIPGFAAATTGSPVAELIAQLKAHRPAAGELPAPPVAGRAGASAPDPTATELREPRPESPTEPPGEAAPVVGPAPASEEVAAEAAGPAVAPPRESRRPAALRHGGALPR
jgi:hypothetical protein